MLSTFIMAILGFLFWIICSRLYSNEQVGFATSIISAATLASVFSTLGFNNAIIRFLANSKLKNNMLSTGFFIVTLAAIFFSIVFYIWFLHAHSIDINHSEYLIGTIFTVFVVCSTINGILEASLIAYRSAKHILIKNIFISICKILLPFVFVSLGYLGIIYSITFATLFGICIGIFFLFKIFRFRLSYPLDKTVLVQTRRYSLGNYVGNIFGILPTTLVPLIVLTKLNATQAAYYYMPMMIMAAINVIPIATAQSLFAEVSNNEKLLHHNLWLAFKNMYAILLPIIISVLLFANIVLLPFGRNYVLYGSNVLRVLAIASLVGAANYICQTLLNIKKLIGLYIFMNFLGALISIIFIYVLITRGLIWASYGVLIGQIATLIIYIIINIYEARLNRILIK